MKKTIIALFALAGIAAGGQGTLTLTNTTSADVITTAIGATTTDWVKEAITLPDNSAATVTILVNGKNSYSSTTLADYAIGGTNVGNGGSYIYSVSFTVKEDAPWIKLNDISAGFVVTSQDGTNQSNGRWATYNWQFVTGTTTTTTLVDYAAEDYWSQASGATGTLTMDFGDSGVELVAGETYTLNLKITGVNNSKGTVDENGGFVHVGTISANLLPEPTTATLSMLALCGLAARRRRR